MYSKKFKQMRDLHIKAHKNGMVKVYDDGKVHVTPPEKVFEGSELVRVMHIIKRATEHFDMKTFYDFGCGKANAYKLEFTDFFGNEALHFYDYIGRKNITVDLYDPGVKEYEKEPPKTKKYDCVISTDVLEHIPFEDIFTVLHDLYSRANYFICVTVSCAESYARLGDGSVNAHCNVRTVDFWKNTLNAFADHYKVCTYADIAWGGREGGRVKHYHGDPDLYRSLLGLVEEESEKAKKRRERVQKK